MTERVVGAFFLGVSCGAILATAIFVISGRLV